MDKSPTIRRMRPALAAALAALLLGVAAGAPAVPPATRTVLFFGDSLTAGLGLADPDAESYPAQVQALIEAEHLSWAVANAGLSGETTAGGLRRIDWVLGRRPDVVVIELGGNDGLRGTAPEVTRANLQAIIDRIRSRAPETRIVVAGLRMPGSMGADFADAFAAIYPDLARRNGCTLIPYLLEGVGGRPDLNQPDGIHPTAAGARIVARTVWKALRPLLVAEGAAGRTAKP
jgi:acyl-CoA thioesterase-1